MKRAIRDMYSSDMEEVLVEGKWLQGRQELHEDPDPSHAKRVQQFKNEGTSLFQRRWSSSSLMRCSTRW